jgi:putative ABC transport system permease protein
VNTLIRLITMRHLLLEPLRSFLMITGIALGVSVFVGVRSLVETTMVGFEAVFSAASQGSDLVAEGSHGGLSEAFLKQIQAAKGVDAAAPILVNYARPSGLDKGPKSSHTENTQLSSRRYLVLGLDLLSPATQKVYGFGQSKAGKDKNSVKIDNPSALALNPQSIIVSESFSQREKLKSGQYLSFFTSAGQRKFLIVGTYKGDKVSAGLGGDVMIMNLRSAQIMFSRKGKLDRIAISVKDKTKKDQIRKELQANLGQGIKVSVPGQSNQRTAKMLGSMQVGLTMASLLALLIGQFLIYNTMTTAIIRRRPEIGILRAVGATKRQLAILWFSEAIAYGLFGGLLGIALGLGVAQLSLGFYSENISNLYEAVDLRTIHFSSLTLILGLISGPFATVLAATLPVREALDIAPVEAARKDLPAKNPGRLVQRLAFLGLSILGLTLLVNFNISGAGLFLGAFLQLGLTLGFAFCAPWGIVWVTTLARPFMGRLFGPSGFLAGDNILKSPLRAGITVAALMVAVGGVLSIAALVFSLKTTIDTWLDNVLTGDYYISASSPLGGQNGTLIERAFQKELLKYPEVDLAVPMRFTFEEVDDNPALFIVLPGDDFGRRSKIPVVAGNLESARKEVVEGRGIYVSRNFARIRKKSLGDTITVTTALGKRSFKIVLICIDYSSEHGTLFFDRAIYDTEYKDTRVNTFNVYLKKGVAPKRKTQIAEDIRSQHGAKYDLFVLENSAFRGSIIKTVEDSFRITYAMELVAICIALLGVINTLFAAVLERTREIGVLRALGAARRHIRMAVVAEAFLLGAMAGGFGVTCGYVLGYVMVTTITAGAFGWLIPFSWPWLGSAIAAVATAFLSAGAGLIPAERAATVDIVEALAYE